MVELYRLTNGQLITELKSIAAATSDTTAVETTVDLGALLTQVVVVCATSSSA